MSASPAPQRIALSPAVRTILEVDTPKSQLLRHFLHFPETILDPDPAGIDGVVSPEAGFHELEASGYPRGPAQLLRRAASYFDFLSSTSIRAGTL